MLTLVPLTFTVRPRFPFLARTRQPIVEWVRKDQYGRCLDEITS
jgi:hypothetical protein